MVTENELMISNKSYVNKDFATIYPELLDYVKILTNKWNPQTSNESDPGVVLLKLLGFMGDKLNYNVDKNVLEDFVLSCTQETSMRKNLYPLGYNMKYYNSATTKIQFTYVGDALNPTSGISKSFTLPALDTVITTDDGSVQFVLTKPITIEGKNLPTTVLAIQGRKDTLVVGDSDVIQLENIDSNNRVYFPISMVAENGIFMHRVDDNQSWTKVKNLNTLTPHQEVFMFGYDSSRGLPYIEFPEDISDLIGNGLHIDYIITNGLDGNVSAKTLTKLASPTSDIQINPTSETISFADEEEASLLIIKNLSASIDGTDPETIDEAYNNFKKTIGTFDTLVTCRDYANYIYNLYDELDTSYVVSNVQVSDRRDDITYSTSVVSFDEFGQKKVNVKNSVNTEVNAYDLFLYPLAPISSYTLDGFDKSFKPLLSTTYIKNSLENSKSASHNYYYLRPSDLYAIKNMVKLNALIATTHKVTNYERKDIISNVISALIKKFNARNVDYGYEIPYDEIKNTIEGADSRISYVNLPEPTIKTKVLTAGNATIQPGEIDLISSAGLDYLLSILAHNILSGKVELFDYDNDFDYDFGQKQITGKAMKLMELASISTKTEIQLTTNEEFELLDNEAILMLAPSLISDFSYSAYTLYNMSGLTNDIPEDMNYQLKSGEVLWIYYTDASTKSVVVKKYEQGAIIQPKGFTLKNTPNDDTSGGIQKTFTYDGVEETKWFPSLGARESIELRKVNITNFDKPTNFYWLRNNANNKLFTSADEIHEDPSDPTSDLIRYQTILGDGEYLFYTDDGFNNLVSLGSGTTIKTNYLVDPEKYARPLVTYEEIEEEGLLALKEKWYKMPLTKYKDSTNGTSLIAQENTILTLTQGDKIKWVKASGSDTFNLDNSLKVINGTVTYTISGESENTPLEQYNLSDDDSKWKIKSRLDINSGRNFAQSIGATRQTITFTNKDGTTLSLGGSGSVGQTFVLNEAYQFIGSDFIDVSSKDLTTNETIYPFGVYCYQPQVDNDETKTLDRGVNGYATYSIDDTHSFDFDVPSINKYKILMLYVILGESTTTLTLTSTGGNLNKYNESSKPTTPSSSTMTITSDGIYNISLDPNVNHLNIQSDKSSITTIVIDYMKFIDADYTLGSADYALNSKIGLKEVATKLSVSESELEGQLLEKIYALDDSTNKQFYYTNRVSNYTAIEQDSLVDPLAFYDVNNIANKFTISQIDMSNISEDIDILRSSRV